MKLLIGRACRSDFPLSDPIIKRLRNKEWCHYQCIYLIPGNFLESYKKAQYLFDMNSFDLVLVVGDRIESIALGICAFFNNQKIAHLGAGIINEEIVTFDDIARHWVTLASDIQFCESEEAKLRVLNLFGTIHKEPNAYTVGNFYIDNLEDLEIDESLVPDEPYDLVLYNPTTIKKDSIDLIKIIENSRRKVIIIGPNPDEAYYDNYYGLDYSYNTLPRPQFLGLLKQCERFISNSSVIYYEAPAFLELEQIIQIGERNKNRSSNFKSMKPGASSKIVEILEGMYR